jgi:hypothetical protein
MSCSNETYAPTADPHRPHGVLTYSDADAGTPRGRQIHHAHARAQDGSRPTAGRVTPDMTKADPAHIWGDEGPVNE